MYCFTIKQIIFTESVGSLETLFNMTLSSVNVTLFPVRYVFLSSEFLYNELFSSHRWANRQTDGQIEGDA